MTTFYPFLPIFTNFVLSFKDEEASNSPKRRRVSNYVRHSPLAASSSPELSGESKTNAWLLNKSNQEFASDGYKTKFVPIESSEQRRVYKAEFNKDYNRYMFLHTQVDRVSRRFAKLQRQLKHTPETSPEYAVSKNSKDLKDERILQCIILSYF